MMAPRDFSLRCLDDSEMKLSLLLKAHLFVALLTASAFAFSGELSKVCAFHQCGVGDVVLTSYSKGSPATDCPTKQLSLYTNYVVTTATFGATESQATGEDALLFKQFRNDAGVSSFKEAMKKCQPLKSGQRVSILEYAERGAVRVSPVRGGASYWTAANHLDRE